MSKVIQSTEKFIDFKRDKCILDDFFFQKLGIEEKYPLLTMILKIIFCMSHEQATTKTGSSYNSVVLKNNMGENTIIARRFMKITFMLVQ